MEANYQFWTLLPPLVAIFLAIVTRRVVLSLFLGIVVGCMTLSLQTASTIPNEEATKTFTQFWTNADGDYPGIGEVVFYIPTDIGEYGVFLAKTLSILFETILWPQLIDNDHMRVLAFTLLMGAMVGVIYRCGGMIGIANVLSPLAKTRVGGQVVTWVLGLIVFFDDYANTLLLGNTMRPVADRLQISREKLAYIVDSTAAPVAGLAIISTWVAALISYVDDGMSKVVEAGHTLAGDPSAFSVVVETIPYRFYVIFALIFVPIVALMKRDFLSMRRAERNAMAGNTRDDVAGLDDPDFVSVAENPKWYNAVVPIVVMLAVILILLGVTGYSSISQEESASLMKFDTDGSGVLNATELKAASASMDGQPGFYSFETMRKIVGNANSFLALLYGSLAGLLAAAFLARMQRILTRSQVRAAAGIGAKAVLPALAILWMAWSLSGVTNELGTGQFLADLLTLGGQPDWMTDSVYRIYDVLTSLEVMPTSIFVIACFVAFATGTSWGTMGIMVPTVIYVIHQMMLDHNASLPSESAQLITISMSHPIMLASIGGVLAGSIFGDHCSPISDTTVLSSQASGCNHISHVRTQMPYAIAIGFVSIVCGTLPVGYGIHWSAMLPVGLLLMFVLLLIFGRPSQPDDQ